jgi:hypothetical protein
VDATVMGKESVQQPGVGRGFGTGKGSKRPDAKLRRFDTPEVDIDKLDVQLGPTTPKPGSRLKKLPESPAKKAPK